MRWSEQQQVCVFYWTCQYIIVNCSRTCFSRCVIDAHRGSLCT
jgi:hypothetical protein